MPKELVIRGLPHSLARDGWWLASEGGLPADLTPPVSRSGSILGSDRNYPRLIGLFALVLLGDQLFWAHRPGLSLAIFAWSIFAIACLENPIGRRVLAPAGLLMLTTLPILEHVQLLSLSFLAAGLLSAVAFLRLPAEIKAGDIWPWLASAVIRLIETIPTAGVCECVDRIRALKIHMKSQGRSGRFSVISFARDWAFPLGGVMVLSALLISANPVLEHMLLRMWRIDIEVFTLVRRLALWVGLALLVWPFLTVRAPDAPIEISTPNWDLSRVLNSRSVFRALVLFNLLLVLQSVMDISILFGGAALPEGMSHATYAHRGAYPLLITALLAGAFALAARPFLKQHHALKPLLLLWLTQNVLLTLSAAFRLNLYIDAFGLTYLRVHALIWMGLVAVGLAMIVWQVLREHSSFWLLSRVAGMGAATLYACTFINFAALIATDTLSRAADPERKIKPDWAYLCTLGHSAAKAIVTQIELHPIPDVPGWAYDCVHPDPAALDWREWDFRTARVNGYLAAKSIAQGEAR
ncbi:DUF4173 domain-containing protein [Ruegeria lacuscaerulensis]|uniref:DUF4153 domain-containing protein n=1 Tax=Ruegeria lacuscaerulensis TaxID=55218 RepID=UPI00147B6B9E|nr:DUF4173 domain-containing protein [Ruegeria lacuscaerulensis]